MNQTSWAKMLKASRKLDEVKRIFAEMGEEDLVLEVGRLHRSINARADEILDIERKT